MKYVELSGWVTKGYALKGSNKERAVKSLEGLRPFLTGLVEKKVFEVYHQEIGRLDKRISGYR